MPDYNGIWANEDTCSRSDSLEVHDGRFELSWRHTREPRVEITDDPSIELMYCPSLGTHSTGTVCLTSSSNNIPPSSSTIVTLANELPEVVAA